MDNETIFNSQLHHPDAAEPVYVDLRNCSREPYTVFISNQDFNGTGEYCFGKFVKNI